MTLRPVLRLALFAAVLGFCGIEALTWARLGMADVVHSSYPSPVLLEDGTGAFMTYVQDRIGHPKSLGVRMFDAEGNWIGEEYDDEGGSLVQRARRAMGARGVGSNRKLGVDKTFETSAMRQRAAGLDGAAYLEREPGGTFVVRIPGPGGDGIRASTVVRAEGGLLVMRKVGTNAVVVAAGPDGSASRIEEVEGGRFRELIELRTILHAVPSAIASESRSAYRWLEVGTRRLVRATAESRPDAPYAALVVRTQELSTPPEGAAAPDVAVAYRAGQRVLVLDPDARVWADVVVRSDESHLVARVANLPMGDFGLNSMRRGPVTLHVASRVESDDPLVEVVRLRRQVLGGPLVTRDLTWRPRAPVQECLAAAACIPLALRPLPLSILSFASEAPRDGDRGATWWWRDPIVAAGHRPLALLANAIVALLCGWRAWRVGRAHAPTLRAARLWGACGALGGPIALLFQRCVLVRAPAERVGEGMRSLALEACPATQTPWPSPVLTGREVIEGA